MSDGWTTPILAFEFATSTADVDFLAGASGRALRDAMNAGHRLDAVFPFAYGGLLVLTAMAHRPRPAAWFAMAAGALAIPADLVENVLLLQITENLANGLEPSFVWLPTVTWTKWCAIGLALGALASLRMNRVVVATGSLALVATLVALVDGTPWTAEGMAATIAFGFAGLIGTALRELWTHRQQET